MNKVLLLASENGAFKGAKVGGIADVIRDLPAPLYEQNIHADVVMPSYGFLVPQTNADFIAEYWVEFREIKESIKLFKTPNPTSPETDCYLLDHSSWQNEPGVIYGDSGNRPFADDANKFALFSVAVAEGLKRGYLAKPDCIHVHDWHSAFFLLCSRFMSQYKSLREIETVLTIHNIAIQGIRPLQYDDSSLEAWFPELYRQLTETQLHQIVDPRYANCINPLRVGINLADRIHVVSPTYAMEILLPSDSTNGYFGGEGLEADLVRRKKQLIGIINGCNYDKEGHNNTDTFVQFAQQARETIITWQGAKQALSGQDYIADNRLEQLQSRNFKPCFVMTSVGRLTDQKVLILRQPIAEYETVLDAVLDKLAQFSDTALFILVGSGDPQLTAIFRQVAARNENFIFLNGYAESLPDWLYQNGDLFLMPSSFEPCGISQMLAMREGQPCLVHGVGGLKDTVTHDKSGFVFNGRDLSEQVNNLLETLEHALRTSQTEQWKKIKRSAKSRRFSWPKVAKELKQKLYKFS